MVASFDSGGGVGEWKRKKRLVPVVAVEKLVKTLPFPPSCESALAAVRPASPAPITT